MDVLGLSLLRCAHILGFSLCCVGFLGLDVLDGCLVQSWDWCVVASTTVWLDGVMLETMNLLITVGSVS